MAIKAHMREIPLCDLVDDKIFTADEANTYQSILKKQLTIGTRYSEIKKALPYLSDFYNTKYFNINDFLTKLTDEVLFDVPRDSNRTLNINVRDFIISVPKDSANREEVYSKLKSRRKDYLNNLMAKAIEENKGR